MDKKIRLRLIGVGTMGSVYVQYLLQGDCPDFILAAVSDINIARKDWVDAQTDAHSHPPVAFFTDAKQMLQSGLIDACIVSGLHYDHPCFAIDCFENNIHVLLEKPAGVYPLQVREMNEVAQKHPELVFGMMLNRRTEGVYRFLYDLMHSGKYGELRRMNWVVTTYYRPQAYFDSSDWRATWAGEGGGVLLNQCAHHLDLLQWIFDMPIMVHAKLRYGMWHDIEVEDEASVYMEFKNGATGLFITSTGEAHGTDRLEIQLDRAKIVLEDGNLTVLEYEMSEQEFSASAQAAFSALKAERIEPVIPEDLNQHRAIIDAFGKAIKKEGKPIADGLEGYRSVLLLAGIYLSDWLGREITFPYEEQLQYRLLSEKIAHSKKKTTGKTVIMDVTTSFKGVK